MAFAIIQTGGKQYRVTPGATIAVEKLEIEAGQEVRFDQVLLYQAENEPLIGQPFIAGAVVMGTVANQFQGKKIRVSTYKPKKRESRTLGHRQQMTEVSIAEILLPAAINTEKAA